MVTRLCQRDPQVADHSKSNKHTYTHKRSPVFTATELTGLFTLSFSKDEVFFLNLQIALSGEAN